MPSATREALLGAMKKAMIEGNKDSLAVIRMLVAEIKYAEKNDLKEPGRERNEDEVIASIAGYHKNLAKSLVEFPADRQDALRREMAIVETFLPKQLSPSELSAEIDTLLASTPERTFGLLMKLATPRFAGRADGRSVSDALKAALAALPPAAKV